MKKYLIIFIALIGLNALNAYFDPLVPEIHSVLGKSVSNPLSVYFLENIGIKPEDFGGLYFQTYESPDYKIQIFTERGIITSIEIEFKDKQTTESNSKALLDYYGLTYKYKEPDHKIWKDDNDAYGKGSVKKAMKREVPYLFLDRYDDNSIRVNKVLYRKRSKKKYYAQIIYINGEFPAEYNNSWLKPAEEHYSKLTTRRLKSIVAAFSGNTIAQENILASQKKYAKTHTKDNENHVSTFWDQYISEPFKITKIIKLFSKDNISKSDLDILVNKYDFMTENGLSYISPDEYYKLFFKKSGENYLLNDFYINNTPEDEYPTIGLSNNLTLEMLEEKFGLCWYKYKNESPYEIYASGNVLNSDYNLKFSFERGAYSNNIKKISIELTDRDSLLLDGNINFLTGGCLWGDCENGKGLYRYTNDKWVVGLFKDGKKTHGVTEKFDAEKVREEIAYQEKNPCSWARRLDNSFWGKLLNKKNGFSAMTLAFNKRDFSYKDREILLNNYWFKYEYDWYKSPDGRISFKVPPASSYIHEIVFSIRTLEDLQSFGFERHYSKKELESMLGYEYNSWSSYFNAVLVPEGDTDKNNHLKMQLGLNTTKNTITSITLRPVNKEKIQITSKLTFLKTGTVERQDAAFQFADGPRFVGKTFQGIPWTGTIYTYDKDIDLMTLQSGKAKRGFTPKFIEELEKNTDPAFKALNKFTRLMDTYRVYEKEMLEHLIDLAENSEDNEYIKSAVLKACKKAEYKLIDARSTFNIVFVNVERSELDCQIASTEIARIFTGLSFFRDVLDTARKLVKQNGKKAPEDEKIMNDYEEYDKQIVKSYDNLVNALFECGFFQRDPEKWSK